MMPFTRNTGMLCAWLCATAVAFGAPTDHRHVFMWNEANSRMMSAHSEKDFAAAAAAYRKLVQAGVRNGPVFYNMGTAELQAKRYADALVSLRRAERFMGTTRDIEHNMLLALAGKTQEPSVALPWYRVLLFWHYGLACTVRSAIAIGGFALLWLGLILRAVGFRRLSGYIFIPALTLMALFGSSVAASLNSEARDSARVQREAILATAQGGT